MLTALGSQLAALWLPDHDDVGQPDHFAKYLEAILAFAGNDLEFLGCKQHKRSCHKLAEKYLCAGSQASEAWETVVTSYCFSGHQSQYLGSFAYSLLMMFLRHDLISKDPVFQSVIPQIIDKARVSFTKVTRHAAVLFCLLHMAI